MPKSVNVIPPVDEFLAIKPVKPEEPKTQAYVLCRGPVGWDTYRVDVPVSALTPANRLRDGDTIMYAIVHLRAEVVRDSQGRVE